MASVDVHYKCVAWSWTDKGYVSSWPGDVGEPPVCLPPRARLLAAPRLALLPEGTHTSTDWRGIADAEHFCDAAAVIADFEM